MTWPQLAMLFYLIGGGVISIAMNARDRELSSTTLTLAIIFTVGARVAVALVLHAGGFW